MTKKELLKKLEKYNDSDEIGAFWDDCAWPIHGIFEASENTETKDSGFDVIINCA